MTDSAGNGEGVRPNSLAGDKSRALLQRAERVIPGGVNSPVRAFRAVGGDPLFLARGEGAHVIDVDGRKYLDFVGSWGPLLFGHADPDVIAAVTRAASAGVSFGAPTEAEVELAETIVRLVPQIQQVRLVSSGTEACMSAVRLARGAASRDKIIKFAGCYHGHGDSFLIKAGSGAATLGLPDSPGVPTGVAMDTLVARYNDLDSVEAMFDRYADEIAAIIVEPVAGNMGCVPPERGFLQGLRAICDREKTLLIFDEVMTGFRVAQGGAQELYTVRADLTVLGKIVGGGLPLAAYGGSAELMARIAPEGPIYQAGTLSGNPLATAAALATLRKVEQTRDLYPRLEALGRRWNDGLTALLRARGRDYAATRVGSFISLFFKSGPVRSWDDVRRCDLDLFARWFRGMLARGVYFAPSQYETNFISYAHTEADIDLALAAASEVLAEV